jgi:lipooligosaccharide transport system permease protein
MNLATSEAAWPILARVAWVRIYHAIVATPLNAADVMVGAIAFIVGKVAFAAAFFAGVLLVTGIATSPTGALGMIAVSVLTAFAFGAIENLPFAAQVLSWFTPLAHSVALSRSMALGTPVTYVWFHVGALLLWGIVGTVVAIYLFRKRMLK